MATFIVLIDYTDEGIRRIGDSPKRAAEFAETAKGVGVTVKELFWTQGDHDGVLVLEASDDKAVSALLLKLVRAGNVRTRTLRAYDRGEMEAILAASA